MTEEKKHKEYWGGYPGEDSANTACGLGTDHDRSYEKGTSDWKEVTCKNCLKANLKDIE